MNEKLKDRILYWIREASEQGLCGFSYDRDLNEQSEDWDYFEKMAMGDIEDFSFSLEWESKRNGQYRTKS